ncbi:hypothetical protein ACO0SA_000813 [Hanseniaspora valbyensis]
MGVSEEQKIAIENNRSKLLERLKSNGVKTNGSLLNTTVKKNNLNSNNTTVLTKNQDTIKDNRISKPYTSGTNNFSTENSRRDASSQQQVPLKAMIRKFDYIDYDLSQMTDSNGGFIDSSMYPSNSDSLRNKNSGGLSSGQPQAGMTFTEWRIAKANQMDRVGMGHLYQMDENKEQPEINFDLAVRKEYIMDDTNLNVLAPLSELPTCESCHKSIEFDSQLLAHFDRKVCRKCVSLKPEKYSLLTKTECKQDYLLTDPELEDRKLFHRMEKQNPHSGTFSRMILFLRDEVEQYAFKKWGSQDKLDSEWARREERKIIIKEKKYQKQLKEMRKKTRAQEFTKKLQLQKFGKEHKHSWCVVNVDEATSCITKECKECGKKIEEIEF